jgi:urease accessory protein
VTLDPRLLQLCDSAFPSGAFSHSFGLETAVAEGRIADARAFAAWLGAYLGGSAATLDARALVLGLRVPDEAVTLDAALSAAVFAVEVRSATRRLARATLDAFAAMGLGTPALAAYRSAVDAGAADGHHPLACALGYAAIGAAARDAAWAYLSATAAGLAAAAARVIPLGQRDVARVLWDARPAIERGADDACAARGVDDLVLAAFDCEIDAFRHQRLDGRMFAS